MNENITKRQTILIFQQKNKAESKIKWIKQHGKKLLKTQLITVSSLLPEIIDDSTEYLTKKVEANLVLDFLEHKDLSWDLAKMCIAQNIPIIASGKKTTQGKKHHTPAVCCALSKSPDLGIYGILFGNPEIDISIQNKKIKTIEVKRGAPCGSTWKAAKKIIGCHIEKAATSFSLNIQYSCKANPANWDPLTGKSAVHIAAELHRKALIKAIKKQNYRI